MDRNLSFLDLDLDAFLNDVAHRRRTDRRLNKKHYKPWSEDEIRHFLEAQCGLSAARPIEGRFVVHHDGAFQYWEQLNQKMGARIDVTHVDAHADLGMGDSSWVHLVQKQVHLPLDKRRDPPLGPKYLNPGSYLAYAAAARLISSVNYVHSARGGNDLPAIHFKNNDPSSGYLEMKGFSDQIAGVALAMQYPQLTSAKATHIEPEIPFIETLIPSFRYSASFDFGLLCQSPGYTPSTADSLIPVIGEYISFQR